MRRAQSIIIILLLASLLIPSYFGFLDSAPVSAQPSLIEDIARRSGNSRTYTTGNGTYFASFLGTNIHYKDSQDSWQNINNAIVPAQAPWNYQMTQDAYTARFLSSFVAGQVVKWEAFGESVAFQPMELQWTNDLSQIQAISMPQDTAVLVTNEEQQVMQLDIGYQQGTIRWNNAYGTGRHFWLTCDMGKLEKVLKLDSLLPTPPSYIINGGNPVARLNFIFAPSAGLYIYVNNNLWDKSTTTLTSNQIEFRNASNQTLWYFQPQRVWDSNNNEIIATGELRKAGGNLYISVRVPYIWLLNASYPVYIDPSPETIYASSYDGWVYKEDDTDHYSTWSASSGQAVSGSGAYVRFGQSISTYYRIQRAYIPVDTSGLPDAALLSAASIYIYGETDNSLTDFNMTIQVGTSSRPDPENNGLAVADYDQSYYGTTNLGQTDTSTFTIAGYNTISYHSNDLGYISTTGLTRVVLRSQREIDSYEPSGLEYVQFHSSESSYSPSRDPYIYITYTEPDVTVDANAYTGSATATNRGGPFWINTTTAYLIYLNSGQDLVYSKTTNGGTSWSASTVIDTGTVLSMDSWADWQTPSMSGTKIHIAYLEADDDKIYYAYLDTSSDTYATDSVASPAGTGLFYTTTSGRTIHHVSITKTVGGNIAIFAHYEDTTPTHYWGFYTSPDADTWTDETEWASPDYRDLFLLYPANLADSQDLWATVYAYNGGANIVVLRTYDDSADSWSSQTIVSSVTITSFALQLDGAIRHSDGHLFLAAWSAYDSATADLRTWDINGASSITAKTDVITNTAEYFFASTFIDQSTDDIYVSYIGGTTATTSVKCYYKKSTDGGTSWSGQTAMQGAPESEEEQVTTGAVKETLGGKFLPAWFNDNYNDWYVSTTNAITITASAGCSPDISIDASSWNVNSGTPVSAGSDYSTGITWCTITNNSGGTINITIHGHDMTGGGYTWALQDSGTPGSMQYGMYAGKDDDDDTYDVIVRVSTTYLTLISSLADDATQDIGLKIYIPTSYTNEGNQKTTTVTLTAVCAS